MDMQFAKSCGFTGVWVGSGVDTIESCKSSGIKPTADYYLSDLKSLNPLIQSSKTNGNSQHRSED